MANEDKNKFEAIVVGGGHAGTEAAAAAQLELVVLLPWAKDVHHLGLLSNFHCRRS